MRPRVPRPSPAMGVGLTALFIALGGTGYAATSSGGDVHGASFHPTKNQIKNLVKHSTAGNATHLGGRPASAYLLAQHEGTSSGEHFESVTTPPQTVSLGTVGHFTFSSTCTTDNTGGHVVTFDVTSDVAADLDGGGVVPAGQKVNIHTNSDALDKQPANAFDQVGSASSSTEIAVDGQEVDVFYNDGVNWPSGNGSSAHDCFAGFTGLLG